MYTTTVTRYEEKKEAEKDVEPLPVPRERIPASQPIIWRNVIGIIVLHFLAVYGFVTGYRDAMFWTWIWSEYTSQLQELALSLSYFSEFPPSRRRLYSYPFGISVKPFIDVSNI